MNVTSQNDATEAGRVRAQKGQLVENIAEMIISCAWKNIGGDHIKHNLSFSPPTGKIKSIEVPIKPDYVLTWFDSQYSDADKSKIWGDRSLEESVYRLKVDKHVFIDGEFVLAVECKSYTENAMFKRILVDFHLLKSIYNDLSFCLIQLETQLGGRNNSPGSVVVNQSTLTLMSYFEDVDMNIITLLEGERNVDKPIHKEGYFKELKPNFVKHAIEQMEVILLNILTNK